MTATRATVLADGDTVRLEVDIEGASYIRDVLLGQWLDHKDHGAKDVADALDEALRSIDEDES